MIPDLGKYESTVLAAYAVTILLILILVGLSLWRSVVTKRQLSEMEARRKKNA